jgi:acyl-CoA thioester hydrolase
MPADTTPTDSPPGRPQANRTPSGSSDPRSGAAWGSNPFQWNVRVYWEDTDAGGIVFYANYLKFFERARTEWLRHLGVSQHDLRARTGGMFVVTSTELRYHRPARLDDSLCVTACLAESGRASLVIDQQAWLGPPGTELLCEGRIRIGWIDALRFRPQRIPAEVLQALQASAPSAS